MVGVLHCGLIAQWRSELASLSLKHAIYSQRRARGSWRGNDIVTTGPVACASLKATISLFLTHDVFIVCALMMPEPHHRDHMATVTPSISGQFNVF
jgi:hypothetical protein